MSIKKTPNVEDFISAAERKSQQEPKREEKPAPVRPEPKIHKTIRMPKWISDELMREAMEESIRTGFRITQEGIVQAMLEERYKDRK